MFYNYVKILNLMTLFMRGFDEGYEYYNDDDSYEDYDYDYDSYDYDDFDYQNFDYDGIY